MPRVSQGGNGRELLLRGRSCGLTRQIWWYSSEFKPHGSGLSLWHLNAFLPASHRHHWMQEQSTSFSREFISCLSLRRERRSGARFTYFDLSGHTFPCIHFRSVHFRTTIYVSHRFNTTRRADKIAVVEAGTITELGSHA